MLAIQPTAPPVPQDEIIWVRLIELVEELGPDPDRIADLFIALGITGCPEDALDCPVVHYLEGELGDVAPIVLDTVVDVRTEDGRRHTLTTPQGLAAFVRNFDRRQYPALIQQASA